MTASSGRAQAAGGWLAGGALAPIEQRVAVASGSDRTTLWTSLRFDAAAGPVGVVIAVPPGASLDHSSDAWLEALEVATAPRILPPDGVSWQCPGSGPGSDSSLHIAGHTDHRSSLLPDETTVLADAASVTAWAAQNAFVITPEVSAALDAMTGMRFVVERFAATGGEALTPTLRVVMPGAAPTVALTLTQAADKDMLVTAWLVGSGRGELTGAAPATVDASALTWNAGSADSNYFAARTEALAAAGAGSALLESSNHEALSHNIAIAGGTASVDGVIKTFFERAAAYGDGDPATAGCIAQAAAALASSAVVGPSCPRADLGVVDGTVTCTETPVIGQTDPDALRCGPYADDLAIALSSLAGNTAWLSRWSMILGPGQTGTAWPITFGPGPEVDLVLSAQSVDLSACGDAGTGPDAGSSSSSSSSTGAQGSTATTGVTTGAGMFTTGAGPSYSDPPPSAEIGCGCSGTADTSDWDPGDEDSSSGAGGYDTGDSDTTSSGDECSGDSSDSADDCEGDTSDTSAGDDCTGDGTTDSADDCDGSTDSAGGDGCDGGDYSGDDCGGGDYSGDDCAGDAAGGDACSGDAAGDVSCDAGSSSGDCAIGSRRGTQQKRRKPKLSMMTFGALALLMPLRRARRPRRRGGKAVKKRR